MRADLDLKTKQSFWETPKGVAAVVAATAVIIGTLAGVLGFKLGQTPTSAPPQVIILQQPVAAKP